MPTKTRGGRRRMAGISVQKGTKPRVLIAHALIDETRRLSDKWKGKSPKAIAQMLHRAIPGYNMTGETQFTLAINIPGGLIAKIPLETIKNGSEAHLITLRPDHEIHTC